MNTTTPTTEPRLDPELGKRLAGLGIIVRAGYRPTLLASGHGRPTALWSLADRTGARAWIDQHGGGTPGEILHAALVVASIEEARQTKHHPPQEEPHA